MTPAATHPALTPPLPVPSILVSAWGQGNSSRHPQSEPGPLWALYWNKTCCTNTYIYIIEREKGVAEHGHLRGMMLCSALHFLLPSCSVMMALVAISVSQETPVARGHWILPRRQGAWSIPGQIPPRHSVPQFPHLYDSHRTARLCGDRHLWAEDAMGCPRGNGTWPQALGHLDLQVLILVGVAGAIAGVIGAKAGAPHLAEERSALLPPQPAKGELPGRGVAEPSPSPAPPRCHPAPPAPARCWALTRQCRVGEPQLMLGNGLRPYGTGHCYASTGSSRPPKMGISLSTREPAVGLAPLLPSCENSSANIYWASWKPRGPSASRCDQLAVFHWKP